MRKLLKMTMAQSNLMINWVYIQPHAPSWCHLQIAVDDVTFYAFQANTKTWQVWPDPILCGCTIVVMRRLGSGLETRQWHNQISIEWSAWYGLFCKELTFHYWTQMTGLLKDVVEVEHAMWGGQLRQAQEHCSPSTACYQRLVQVRQRPLQDRGGRSVDQCTQSLIFYMHIHCSEAVNNGCMANLYTWPSVVEKPVGAFKVDWIIQCVDNTSLAASVGDKCAIGRRREGGYMRVYKAIKAWHWLW